MVTSLSSLVNNLTCAPLPSSSESFGSLDLGLRRTLFCFLLRSLARWRALNGDAKEGLRAMATILDLSEETGRSAQELQRLLRARGIRVDKLTARLPLSAVRICREAGLRGGLAERLLGHAREEPPPPPKRQRPGRRLTEGEATPLPAGDPVAALRAVRAQGKRARAKAPQARQTVPQTLQTERDPGDGRAPQQRGAHEPLDAAPSLEHALERERALQEQLRESERTQASLSARVKSLEARLQEQLKAEERRKALDARPPEIITESAARQRDDAAERPPPVERDPSGGAGKAPLTLWRRLERLGLADVSLLPALAARFQDPKVAPGLLSRLRCARDFDPFEGCVRCCDDLRCQAVAARRGLPLTVPEYFCVICQGNERDRLYQWLRAECLRIGETRLVLVGGSQDGQQALRGLSARFSGLDWTLITGGEQIHQSRALQLCRGASIVALWPNDHLKHRVSDLFRDAARREGRRLISVPPGRQGVGALIEELLTGLSLSARGPERSGV